MADTPSLNDPAIHPDRDLIAIHLGAATPAWDGFESVLGRFQGIEGEWRYYTDGKSWLYKVSKKGKTVCWVSIWSGYFQVGFYFAESLCEKLLATELPPGVRTRLESGKPVGKLRSVAIQVREEGDLEDPASLIEMKLR